MNPYPLTGVAGLMRLALSGTPLQALVDRAALSPDPADKLIGLSFVFQLFGNKAASLEMQQKALKFRRLFILPCENPKRRLLVLMKEGDMQDNTPIDFLTSDSDLLLFYSSDDLPVPDAIPEHDCVFVAMGESSDSSILLAKTAECLESWPKRVLNHPEGISALSRNNVCRLLSAIEGLVVPETEKIARNTLSAKAFPFIARPIDSHAGLDLEKFESLEDVGNYLSRVDGEDFYASQYVDYKSPDGLYRKYRIAMVDGKPYPCHMAINEQWMVSYRNSEMEKSPEKRAEEAEFMTGF
ncbi:MAG TPA: RimK family alpha-L-glutamate ligase, partial [Burkholderiales bacterium]|nr:RimK family alpha-L-glutamate ligase [Burkholderiales bacterium]